MNASTSAHTRTALVLGFFAALALASPAARAATYYVDASGGNDAGNGASPASAWKTLAKVNSAVLQPGDSVLFKRGETWRGQLVPRSGSSSGHITYGAFGTGAKPLILGSVRRNRTSDWVSEGGNIWTTTAAFNADVGNLILNGEKICGVKVASRGELNAQGKFWFNGSTRTVSMYSGSNPASHYSDIECAVTAYIINEAGKSWVIYDNLALKYGGSHGIGGSAISHIIVKDLDISWIGGGAQDASGIRFGNGIEFIGAASDILVEGCRIWECYDAGLTNQNLSATLQSNIHYRNNTVWNCEYSFEYWSNQSGATTRDIYFENNTCAYAGGGWGYAQRPLKTGRHLHFDDNRATTSNFHIRNNVFYQARDNNIYLSPTWNNLSALDMDYNCWHNSLTGNMAVWQGTYYPMTQFASWQSRSGKDAHGITGDPLFSGAGALDFRLTSGSPCIDAGYPGSTDPDGTTADLGAEPYGGGAAADTRPPVILSVVISPNSGTVTVGESVRITITAANGETGLTPSPALINGRSIPLAEARNGLYTGAYTVQAGDPEGVNIEATGVTLRDPAGNVSAPASSSGSTLSVVMPSAATAPAITSVTLSPDSGWLKAGSTVLITVREADGRAGLTASPARINGRNVPLSDRGDGTYIGTYTVQTDDPQGVNIEAEGITLSTTMETGAVPLLSESFDSTPSGWATRGNAAVRDGRLEVTADGMEDMMLRTLPADLNEAWCTYRIYVNALSLPSPGDKSVGCGFISPNAAKGAYAGFVNRNGTPVWRLEYSTDTANVAETVSSVPVETGRWHEVTLRYARSGGNNTGSVELWLNGARIAAASGLDNDTLPAHQIALGDRYGVKVRGTLFIDDVRVGSGAPGSGGTVLASAPASSSGSTLRVDTIPPAVTSVKISPSSGTVYPGDRVAISVVPQNYEMGLAASDARINGRSVPLTGGGSGLYTGIYTVQVGDPEGVNIEATGVTLRDPAGNVSAPAASSGSTLRVAMAPEAPELLSNPSFSSGTSGWSVYTESGAVVSTGPEYTVYDTAPSGYRIQCSSNGSAYYHIQLMTTQPMAVAAGKTYTLTFRARCTRSFRVNSIVLMKQSSPWSWYQTASSGTSPYITTSWQGFTATFTAGMTAADARLTFYLGDSLPDGAVLYLDTMSFHETSSFAAKTQTFQTSTTGKTTPEGRVSERCIYLGTDVSSDSLRWGCGVRNLTCGINSGATSDTTAVTFRTATVAGQRRTVIEGIEPGARYVLSLPERDDRGMMSGRYSHRLFTTLAAFVDDDLDPSDPFIMRDGDSLFVADNDRNPAFVWSSWKAFGAVSYHVTVLSHHPKAVVSTQTVEDTRFEFTGEPGQVYSLEIRPLDASGTELGLISTRAIRCAPGRLDPPGKPVIHARETE